MFVIVFYLNIAAVFPCRRPDSMLEMCWCFWICETLRDFDPRIWSCCGLFLRVLVLLVVVLLPLLGFYCRGGFVVVKEVEGAAGAPMVPW